MKALVIGSGRDVIQELALVDRAEYDLVIGVNQAAVDFGPVHVHATLHPISYLRSKAAYMVAPVACKGVDEVLSAVPQGAVNSGSGGLYAVRYALRRGAENVLICGVGLAPQPHYYGGANWDECMRFRSTWEMLAPLLRGKVRSMGGWTKELLE